MMARSKRTQNGVAGFIGAAGVILGVSYPVLALSTGVRAIYQLGFERPIENVVGSSLSLLAALCYVVATIGFFKRTTWAWKVSVGVLCFESLMTLLVGILSLYPPTASTIGRTVWRQFGADYGYFPLIQPLLGLAWLFHPDNIRLYGVKK